MTGPPPYKDALGRPAIELVGVTGEGSIPSFTGGGLCVIGAEWGSGTSTATVIAGEYGELPRVPFELDMERWEVLAYDTSGNPLSISCVIDVQAATYVGNSFLSIAGSEKPTLASETQHDSTTLAGWRLINPVDTMYRFVLVSFTGSPAKIVLGIRCFVP